MIARVLGAGLLPESYCLQGEVAVMRVTKARGRRVLHGMRMILK